MHLQGFIEWARWLEENKQGDWGKMKPERHRKKRVGEEVREGRRKRRERQDHDIGTSEQDKSSLVIQMSRLDVLSSCYFK